MVTLTGLFSEFLAKISKSGTFTGTFGKQYTLTGTFARPKSIPLRVAHTVPRILSVAPGRFIGTASNSLQKHTLGPGDL